MMKGMHHDMGDMEGKCGDVAQMSEGARLSLLEARVDFQQTLLEQMMQREILNQSLYLNPGRPQ